jgi:hypothetical protein
MRYTTAGFSVDELEFIQHVPARVLVAVARGVLDLNNLSKEELVHRGLSQDGLWVGDRRATTSLQLQKLGMVGRRRFHIAGAGPR